MTLLRVSTSDIYTKRGALMYTLHFSILALCEVCSGTLYLFLQVTGFCVVSKTSNQLLSWSSLIRFSLSLKYAIQLFLPLYEIRVEFISSSRFFFSSLQEMNCNVVERSMVMHNTYKSRKENKLTLD